MSQVIKILAIGLLCVCTSRVAIAAKSEFSGITLFEMGQRVSTKLGYTVLFSPRVRTGVKVKVFVPKKLNGEELYDVFLTILNVHGYAGIRNGNVLRVVRERKARSSPIPVRGGGS
jgi:general secretion pathway protein D